MASPSTRQPLSTTPDSIAAGPGMIPRVVRGSGMTLMDADFANRLIDTVNAISNMRIVTVASGPHRVTISGQQMVVQINPSIIAG